MGLFAERFRFLSGLDFNEIRAAARLPFFLRNPI
jgi:hypothetical protein